MCRIAGIFYFNNEKMVGADFRLREKLQKMCDVLIHRGPDESGIYTRGNIGLGYRRLNIIDLSSRVKQPMFNEDRNIVLVYDGEIYDSISLREELVKKGDRFFSSTDSEIFIHLYEQKGLNCLKDMEGGFAFALWDKTRKRLFLARDRVGNKSLYYLIDNDKIIFSSELNAFRKIPDLNLTLDYDAINLFLEYQYIPYPFTIFRQIKKLPPAHYLLFENDKWNIRKYWEVSYWPKIDLPPDEIYEKAELMIQESVKKRMTLDVPLGALLSGGVDSSLVVWYMSQLSTKPVKTFSIGFKEEEFNELPYAKKVAQICQTDHHEIIMSPLVKDDITKIILSYGEPFGDKSAIPTYYACRAAKKHIAVALCGDGGDELCLGYPKYQLRKILKFWMKLPYKIRLKISQKNFFPHSLRWKWSIIPEFQVLIYSIFWNEKFKDKLYRREFRDQLNQDLRQLRLENLLSEMNHYAWEPEEKLLWGDTHSYLPALLVKMDVASMANSLKVRAPFLDYKLIEFFSKIDLMYKNPPGNTKYLLKKIAEKYFPKENIYREKQGFAMPVSQWVKEDFLDLVHNYVIENRPLWDLFSKQYFFNIFQQHKKGLIDHGQRIWVMLVLGIWLKESF